MPPMRLVLVPEIPRNPNDVPEVQKPVLESSTTQEEWRPHPKNALYEISTFGRARRITYLKSFVDMHGYSSVSLSTNGRGRNYRLHRDVALAFLPNPDNLPQVNHKDLNKTNPRLDNLEWTTVADNVQHSHDTDVNRKTRRGEGHTNAKLNDDKVRYILANPDHKTQRDLAREFGVTQHAIAEIIARRTWKHINGEAGWKPPPLKGENHNMAKLTWEKVREIRTLDGTTSHHKIALRFGVSRPTISMILAGKLWPEKK